MSRSIPRRCRSRVVSTTFSTKTTTKVGEDALKGLIDGCVRKDGQAIFKRTYAVSNDRTILVSPLEPGKTYITVLVAGDGIRSETKSDPQYVTTLGKGLSSLQWN